MDYKDCERIDLHIHSNASDGSFSPDEIIKHALKLGLKAISITDHDTVEGSKQALKTGIPDSLKFLTGVEISADPPPDSGFSGSCHIIGYLINIDNLSLNNILIQLRDARKNRNPKIIKKLNDLNINITLDEVAEYAGEQQVGRPHIAGLMVKNKLVSSIDEAFNRYLAQGKPAYVDKFRLKCKDAIDLIKGAGGIPVLAHPCLLKNVKENSLEAFIKILKSVGLMGIEVYYPDHTPEMSAQYAAIAKKFGLIMTGGTDFHGSLKPNIAMGSGRGDLIIPYELYENLIAAAQCE